MATNTAMLRGAVEAAPSRRTNSIWARFRRHRLALFGLAVLVGFGLSAVFADALALRSPNRVDMDSIKSPPSAQHILGTDAAGRDVYARLVHGARISMSVGLAAVLISGLIGTTI